MNARGVALLTAVWAAAVAGTTPAAETYPVRPIRVIVPQSAGGSTDLAARMVTQRLDDVLKATTCRSCAGRWRWKAGRRAPTGRCRTA